VLDGFVETGQVIKLQTQLSALREQLAAAQLERLATRAALDAGVPPVAVEDAVARIQNAYEVRDGQAIPHDPVAPSHVGDFLNGLRQSAPHLFDAAAAPASETARSKPSAGQEPVINPWKKGQFNLTEQNRLVKRNPELAKRLAAEAGVYLELR
jgi:hypothetical protein